MSSNPAPNPTAAADTLRVIDLGRMPYRAAYDEQRRVHEQVVAGDAPPTVLTVEHEPVITVSRRRGAGENVLLPSERLAELGIDVQETDRGGDVTYHGPGQLVVYPIIRLNDYRLNVGRYIKLLEQVVIDTVAAFGVEVFRVEGCTGVWVEPCSQRIAIRGLPPTPLKLAAIGVRVSRGVTLHGLALNVTTDLSHFDTIVPCGLAGKGVTSLGRVLSTREDDVSRRARLLPSRGASESHSDNRGSGGASHARENDLHLREWRPFGDLPQALTRCLADELARLKES